MRMYHLLVLLVISVIVSGNVPVKSNSDFFEPSTYEERKEIGPISRDGVGGHTVATSTKTHRHTHRLLQALPPSISSQVSLSSPSGVNSKFGCSLAGSDVSIAVGACGANSDAGAVYLYYGTVSNNAIPSRNGSIQPRKA
jgi:hypothetical protein